MPFHIQMLSMQSKSTTAPHPAPRPAPAEGDVGEVALLVPGHAREEDAAEDAWVVYWVMWYDEGPGGLSVRRTDGEASFSGRTPPWWLVSEARAHATSFPPLTHHVCESKHAHSAVSAYPC